MRLPPSFETVKTALGAFPFRYGLWSAQDHGLARKNSGRDRAAPANRLRSPPGPSVITDPVTLGQPLNSAMEISRISTLRTLPVTVIGKLSTTRTYRGIL